MADPISRILAELNTSWNTGVIAKPTYFNYREYKFHPPNSIGVFCVNARELDVAPGDVLHHRIWPFIIYIFTETDANREKLIEEVLRITRAYSATNLKWKVDDASNFQDFMGLKTCEINGREEMEVAVSAW